MTLLIPSVDPGLPGLCIAQPTRQEPFLVEGPRLRFVGTQTRGGGQVLFRDALGMPDVTAVIEPNAIGRAANLVLYPGLARRDFTGPGGSSVETVVAAPTLPFLTWQLTGAAANERSVVVELATPSASPTVEERPEGVVVSSGDRDVRLLFSPPPAAIEVSVAEGGIVVSARLSADVGQSLVLSAGSATEALQAERAAHHLGGHALRAARPDEETLRIDSGVEAVDDGLAWALARTSGLVVERPASALGLGLAAVAVGARTTADAALTRLRAADSVAAALLAARIGSTSGDTRAAADLADALLADELLVDVGHPSHALVSLAARSLADALQYGATPEVLAALRTRASSYRPATAAPTRGSLPMAGRPSTGEISLPMAGPRAAAPGAEASSAIWLQGTLSGDPGMPAPVEDVRASRARRAAASFPTEPDRAWAEWRALLDEGIASGPVGPATWDALLAPAPVASEQPTATAELILAFVHGMLGMAPDAPVGRLRLAPRIPGHLTRFGVEGIPIGEGTLRMGYTRRDREIVYTLEPERIGVPPLVVFEPSVVGDVRSVTVDGAHADLDVRTEHGRSVVPVQLPVDSTRTVAVTVA